MSLEKTISNLLSDSENNWLDFEKFMELVLQDPEYGYYHNKPDYIGKQGDFVTAPEMGVIFAKCLARFINQCLPSDGVILELGAGNGTLARDILSVLPDANYQIIETSPVLTQKQQQTIERAGLSNRCSWLTQLPENFSGVIIGNEVLDALPCAVLIKHDNEWYRRGISKQDNELVWQRGPKANNLDQKRIDNIPDDLADGYCLEINHQAEALVASLVSTLAKGVILLIDYGFEQHELYHPQRYQGTLVAHHQHKLSTDILANLGQQDITAHIDFEAMATAGKNAGADLGGFTTQANFLINLGIDEIVLETTNNDLVEQSKLSQQLQTLLMPQEMGDIFKCLALTKNIDTEILGFSKGN